MAHAPCERAQVVLKQLLTKAVVEAELGELRGLEQQRHGVAHLTSNVAEPALRRAVLRVAGGAASGGGGAAVRRCGGAAVWRARSKAGAVREGGEPRGERLLGGDAEHGGRDLLAAQVERDQAGQLREKLLGRVGREVAVLVWLGLGSG